MGYVVSRETMNAAIEKNKVARPSLENILNEAIADEIAQGKLCETDGCDCEAPASDQPASLVEEAEGNTGNMGYNSSFSQ